MESSAPSPRTLPARFSRALDQHADRVALTFGSEAFTYRDLDDRSDRLAAALVASGVEPEDRVAVYLDNHPWFVVTDLAIMKAGATRLPINPMISGPELEFILTDSRASTLVCGTGQLEDVAAVADDLPTLDRRWVVGAGDDAQNDLPTGFETVEAVLREAPTTPPSVAVAPESIAGHFYTGGTTGRPKGVLYSHRGLVACLDAHLDAFGFDEDDVGVLAPPLSHSAGTFCWAALLAGGRVVIQDGFDPASLLAAIEREAATWTFVVPTMLYRLLDHPGLERADRSTLEQVLYGAAPMRPDRLAEAIDRLGPIFVQFYGQTEVPNLISTMTRADHAAAVEDDATRLRSAGRPCEQADVRIVDPETGEERPPGEPGEVIVRAPYAFEGYFERPGKTAATIRDGWVHTGDVGLLADGYLYLLDRLDDVIVSGGLNVYAGEVEAAIARHPGVGDVVVIGIPDDDWGEAVHAIVVADDSSLTDADIRAFVADDLAAYKKPKSVSFVETLPKTTLGKLDRASLREQYWRDEDRRVG